MVRSLAENPLDCLPRGYSSYRGTLSDEFAQQGIEAPEDVERNRRIDPDEERRIVAHLEHRRDHALTLKEKAEAAGLWLLFQLALCTAMRLRELYTLTMDQIRLDQKTIFLKKTKNGSSRQVPLTLSARALLTARWPALEALRKEGRLLHFWDGRTTNEALKETTASLSATLADIFEEVGSVDLHFHDTRYEAICRWVLKNPTLTSEKLRRAAGMSDPRTRARYLSLRASEIELVG